MQSGQWIDRFLRVLGLFAIQKENYRSAEYGPVNGPINDPVNGPVNLIVKGPINLSVNDQ